MLPTHPFGNTGHASTRIIFGAAAFSSASQGDADRAMELAIESGINHIDTAASYGDSEIRLGPWIEKERDRFFLATKTGEREAGPAFDQIRRSLDRLRTDQIDLIQLHNLVDESEWKTALGPNGALQAAIQARNEGLVRFIGVTGHGVTVARMHIQSLQRFPFDSVLLPYSWILMQDTRYAADFNALLEVCQERNVAVQTIKAITAAPWGDRTQFGNTWYEPLTEQSDIDLAVHWVLGQSGVFLNTAADISLLPKVLDAASRYGDRPTEPVMEQLARDRSMAPLFV